MRTLTLLCCTAALAFAAPPALRVSDNQRFLVTAEGKPFFYLGDTAWELFHRSTREEAAHFLENRARKGFTVIQVVALAEFDGITAPNAYGYLPLTGADPLKPDTKPGPSNDYWDHVDFVVNKANELGLYIGFLPTWGDKWNKKWGKGPEIFTPANAEAYGEWIGRRYKDAALIWILGGDRPVETDSHREIIRAMARGLRTGDGGAHLMTFHPTGGQGSAEPFHSEEWLSFNMRQNGHQAEFTGRYDKTLFDYGRTPTKPVIDGEPVYEDHPVSFKAAELGHSISADIRRTFYWDVFTGAFGHTYGHHSVWQMASEKHAPVNNPLLPWTEAIDQPAAAQMGHGRRLMESRPFLSRIPDDSVLAASKVPTAMPGAGRYRFVATREQSGSYAMIYAPVGRRFSVRMDKISGTPVNAWWFNPRTGKADRAGTFPNSGVREFIPPDPGEMIDWVLVLDDASKNFGPPGQASATTTADGWKPLFNGTNLDGWQVVGDGKWHVLAGGVLFGQASSGEKAPFGSAWPANLTEKQYHDWRQTQSWLYTVAEFGEFDLHLEYLTPAGGNSGISLRDATRGRFAIGPSPDYNKTPAHHGYEIQIINAVKTKYPSGSIYLFAPATFGQEKPNDWNSLDIESRNGGITVRLNGHPVASHPGDPARPKTGPIGLQLHDRFNTIQFRDIRIREIRH